MATGLTVFRGARWPMVSVELSRHSYPCVDESLGLVDHLGGLKDSTDAAAKLAELGADYDVDYIESELSLREELMMQLRSQALQFGLMTGIIAPRSDLQIALDPVLEQARSIARLNDPRGLYAYCWCREPRGTLKGLLYR